MIYSNSNAVGGTLYGRRVNGPTEKDPSKIAGVGPKNGSAQDAAGASGGAALADAMKRQQDMRDQFANTNGMFDMAKMIEAIRARAAATPTPTLPALPAQTLPAQTPMQAPPAANWMQGPMLAPMQAALARRNQTV